jgi:hypothetical protein
LEGWGEDEFIDRDLAQQRAQTDVVQSLADANRNISLGTKAFLQQSGLNVQVTHSDADARVGPKLEARSSANLQSR